MSTSGFLDPHAPPASAGVDLAALVDRNTPLAWFEAVAIVQEMCAVLLATRRPGAETGLEPDDVAITHEGHVEVRSAMAQGLPPACRVAHLLLALLGEAETLPVQLRLLALQEVAPTPSGTTLREWSASLEAFERPGRQRTIRDVYERFMLTPPHEAGTQVTEAAPIARIRPTVPRWWRSRKLQAAAASAALLVGAGLAAVWLWQVVAPMLAGLGDRQQPESSAAVAETLSAEAVERIRAAAFRIWGGRRAQPATSASDTLLAEPSVDVVVPAVLPTVPAAEPLPMSPAPATAAPAGAAGADTVFSAVDVAVGTSVAAAPEAADEAERRQERREPPASRAARFPEGRSGVGQVADPVRRRESGHDVERHQDLALRTCDPGRTARAVPPQPEADEPVGPVGPAARTQIGRS